MMMMRRILVVIPQPLLLLETPIIWLFILKVARQMLPTWCTTLSPRWTVRTHHLWQTTQISKIWIKCRQSKTRLQWTTEMKMAATNPLNKIICSSRCISLPTCQVRAPFRVSVQVPFSMGPKALKTLQCWPHTTNLINYPYPSSD